MLRRTTCSRSSIRCCSGGSRRRSRPSCGQGAILLSRRRVPAYDGHPHLTPLNCGDPSGRVPDGGCEDTEHAGSSERLRASEQRRGLSSPHIDTELVEGLAPPRSREVHASSLGRTRHLHQRLHPPRAYRQDGHFVLQDDLALPPGRLPDATANVPEAADLTSFKRSRWTFRLRSSPRSPDLPRAVQGSRNRERLTPSGAGPRTQAPRQVGKFSACSSSVQALSASTSDRDERRIGARRATSPVILYVSSPGWPRPGPRRGLRESRPCTQRPFPKPDARSSLRRLLIKPGPPAWSATDAVVRLRGSCRRCAEEQTKYCLCCSASGAPGRWAVSKRAQADAARP